MPRKKVKPDLASTLIHLQDKADGACHLLVSLGYQGKKDVRDLGDLLTGADYDELDRPARPETALKIAELTAKISSEVDKFKFSN